VLQPGLEKITGRIAVSPAARRVVVAHGDPSAIPLADHALIQLDVGKPLVPYVKVSFGNSGL